MLAYLVERAAARLREHGLLTGSVEVRLIHVDTRPAHLRRRDPAHRWLRARRRPAQPSASTRELWRHARELLRSLPRRRALVKRVGVTFLALRPAAGHQGQLFSDPQRDHAPGAPGAQGSHADREHRLDQALDELRRRHGFGRVLRGSSLPLIERFPLGPDGFQLRTPSLNQ